jgi:RimJ/RimL family protein N-acetyltransferase
LDATRYQSPILRSLDPDPQRGQIDTGMVGERFPELKTAHCVLRPITVSEAEPLHDVWSSPGVRRFLWDDEIIPIERTRTAIEKSQRMFEEYAFGLWGVWPTCSRNLIGFCGLWPFREPPELELLYGIAEPFWGQGYATEVAQAVMTYCFESLDMPVVRASTDTTNAASMRVLDKLGFACVRRATVSGLDTAFYELWRKAV